jgi:hypothetical protein
MTSLGIPLRDLGAYESVLGFQPGLWYSSPGVPRNLSGATITPLTARFHATPFAVVGREALFSHIGIHVSVIAGGQNLRAAIYTNALNPDGTSGPSRLIVASDTGAPGFPLGTVADVSSQFAAPLLLVPGLYWLCYNISGGAAQLAGTPENAFALGSTSADPINGIVSGWRVADAFANFPNLVAPAGLTVAVEGCPISLKCALL